MKHLLPVVTLLCSTALLAQDRRTARPAAIYDIQPVLLDTIADRGGIVPVNDNCENAITIVPGMECYNSTYGNNSNATADGPDASCDDPGANLLDIWYTFTTGTSGATSITIQRRAAMTDWNYVLYTGGCNENEVVCRIQPNYGQQETLLPSTQYHLRIYSNPNYGTPGGFDLCIQDLATFTPPANDDCANVVPAPLALGGALTFTGDATYATNTEGLPYNSVWHAFTTSVATDLHFDLCGTTSQLGIYWAALYKTCPADLTDRRLPGSFYFDACSNARPSMCFGNLLAGTYYYALSNAWSPGTYTIHVAAEHAGSSAPLNDDCTGATPLNVTTTCAPSPFTSTCGSASTASGGCLDGLAFAEDDVWYSFTAPTTTVAVGMMAHSSQYGPVLEAYSGPCGSLASIGCINSYNGETLELVLTGLVVGETYFLKAYNGNLSTPSDDASYDLCMVEGSDIHVGLADMDGTPKNALFPNPTHGDFTIRTRTAASPTTVSVFDAAGRMVMSTNGPGNELLTVHGTGRLHPGSYVVRISDGNGTTQHRLVVQ